MAASSYDRNVFINCPFDGAYRSLFEAIVFTVFDCGFRARCGLETEDAGQVRIEKIFNIIAECKFGINDLSRTELDPETDLPRFNMPLELGIFLGARRFGDRWQREKRCLILDREKYRYRAFLSDIAGQDVREHSEDPTEAILVTRNWLRNESGAAGIPSGRIIGERYRHFREQLPALCKQANLSEEELIFTDFTTLISEWLKRNA